MSKNAKKVNPYEKKNKRNIKISRKQWTAILSLLGVVAILAGIIVMSGLGGGDPHAGHNHDDEGNTAATDEHGHPVGAHGTADNHGHGNTTGNVRYEVYTNADKTYSDAIYNSKNELLLKRDSLPYRPYKTKDASGLSLIYCQTAEYGYTSGDTIFCNEDKQVLSDVFHGVLATDGVRVAYCSADDTKVLVQDIFNKKVYYKEYDLPNVVENGYSTVQHAVSRADKKTVTVTYTNDKEGNTVRYPIKLYE